jgi:tRNA A-37 threonylcarbamoyl transferase component Bud32
VRDDGDMPAGDQLVGAEVAGYTIESVLGRGGMGVVYVARQRSPERRVALKVIRDDLADDEQFRQRFLREARAAAAIEHPNILPVYDAGGTDGVLYIAMRLVDGTDLRSMLRAAERVPTTTVVTLIEQIGAALDAAHARGLVHRDVKPGNILVTDVDGRPFGYLTDFGVSTWTSGTAPTITATGRMVGTIDYAAPEQIEGSPPGLSADLYSLGCVLFECLTGRPPFERPTPVATLYAHLHEPPPAVTSARDDLPPAIDAVVARALEKSPGARYASGRELGRAVRDALEGSGTTVVTRRPPAPARRRRRGGVVVAAAVLVALAAAGVAFALWPSAGSSPPTAGPRAHLIRTGVQVTATATAPQSTDGAGNVVTYVPGNVVDGHVETAWRAPGNGAGVTLTLLFDNPVDIVRIGLIPGYAKSDPATGVNRFFQDRIVREVEYELPGRDPITQDLRPSPVPQFVQVGVTTTRLTIRIARTSPPGGGPRFDYTAISEVYVYGFAE